MRWIGKKLDEGVALILEGVLLICLSPCIFRSKKGELTCRGGSGGELAGGVGTLSYEHHNISEPAILYVPPLFSSVISYLPPIFFFFPLLHTPR